MVSGRPHVITGVLPADFHPQLVSPPAFVATGAGDVEVYRANVIRPSTGPGVQILNVVGSLKPGVSIERARAELERIRELRRPAGQRTGGPPHLRVVPYADKLVGDARTPLIILQAAVALVLLIVCVNTANLLLVRGSARQREIAIRAAIGAGRARVLRQFFVESLMLGAMGCAAGVLAARGLTAVVVRLLPLAVPRLSETAIDSRVLVFALGACVATTFVFALAPAIAVWKTNVYETLKDGAQSASSSLRSVHVRSALVAIEVALTVVLLVAAGLMVKSFWHMTAYPPGFAPDRVLTMRVQFSGPRYRDPQNQRAFIDELLRRAAAAPGVEAAGVGSNGGAIMLLTIEGEADTPPEQKPRGVLSSASEGYASALGLRVVKGRWLTDLLLLGTFALSALVLVIIGIYGVVAYAVAQRTKEIGVRIAPGAARGHVVAMVVRQGMAITLGGIALGVAAALASTRVMTALLYEVTPTDFATFAAAVMTVGVTAFAACCGPAVKASLIDPLVALRRE